MDDIAGELTPVAEPEVDLVRLQAELRSAAAARRGGELPGGTAALDRVRPAGPRHSPAIATAEILPYAPLGARGRLAAVLAVPLQRLVRRALRWYLWPVTGQLSAHNRAASHVLAEHARQLAWVRMEAERTGHDLDLLDRGRRRGG